MISNPSLVLYACIAKGGTILTEFSSKEEPGIEATAKQCVEKTPPNHSMFSHTVRNRTYTFVIEDPFAYFAIFFDEGVEKSESLWFLNRVKGAFQHFLVSNSIIMDFDNLTGLCFQGQFGGVFREILGLDIDLGSSYSEDCKGGSRNPSLDSSGGKPSAVKPLLAKPSKLMMKKKKRVVGAAGGGEANGDHHHHHHHHHHVKDGNDVDGRKMNDGGENGNVVSGRYVSVPITQKGGGGSGGGFYLGDGRQRAKQIWRKHVWVVLILDLVVCAILFGIWLWVCSGFKCIDG